MLSEAIIKRCSIRKYLDKPLSDDLLEKIQSLINDVKPLFNDSKFQIDFVKDGKNFRNLLGGIIGSYGKVYAPHYLVASCDSNTYEDIGYMLEYIVLKLTELNIGTCFIGGGIKKDLFKDYLSLPRELTPVIVVAVGYPENSGVFRKSETEFKRKPLEKIASGDFEPYGNVMRLVRLSPSAMNLQPWEYHFTSDNEVDIYRVKPNILIKKYINEMNRIDLGISLCHFEIGLNEIEKGIKLVNLSKESKNKIYFNTIIIRTSLITSS